MQPMVCLLITCRIYFWIGLMLCQYIAPKDQMLHVVPEDDKLLQEDVSATPVKKDGLKRKERPVDIGMSWLVKTQYISPISTDSSRQSFAEKHARELRETRGRHILDSLNSRKKKIKDIVSSTNNKLQPVEILLLFPDFERRKKTPFQKHREEEEAKKKRAEDETARLYAEFLELFQGDAAPGSKAFVQ